MLLCSEFSVKIPIRAPMIEWTYFFSQLYSKHSGLVMFKLHLKISNRYLKRGHGWWPNENHSGYSFFGTFLGIILNCVLLLPMYYRLHHRHHFGGVKFTNSTTRKWTAWVILVLDQFKLPSLSSWKCNTHKNRVLLQNFERKFFCLGDLVNKVKTSIKSQNKFTLNVGIIGNGIK